MDFELSEEQVALGEATRALLAQRWRHDRCRAALDNPPVRLPEDLADELAAAGWIGIDDRPRARRQRGRCDRPPASWPRKPGVPCCRRLRSRRWWQPSLSSARATIACAPLVNELAGGTRHAALRRRGALRGLGARRGDPRRPSGGRRPGPVGHEGPGARHRGRRPPAGRRPRLVVARLRAGGRRRTRGDDRADATPRRPVDRRGPPRRREGADRRAPRGALGVPRRCCATPTTSGHRAAVRRPPRCGRGRAGGQRSSTRRERVQFGHPIGSFQAVAHPLADRMVEVEIGRSLLYAACLALDEGQPGRPRATCRRPRRGWATRRCRRPRRRWHVHGGIGFTWELDVHLYLRRALAGASSLGDADHHRDRVADLLDAGLLDQGEPADTTTGGERGGARRPGDAHEPVRTAVLPAAGRAR